MQRLSLSLILTFIIGVNASASGVTSADNSLFPSKTPTTLQLITKTAPDYSRLLRLATETCGELHLRCAVIKGQFINENNTKYLEIDQDFPSDYQPDLKLILHKSSMIKQNVQQGYYANLRELKSFNSFQPYLVPQEIYLNKYKSVAIRCKQFNATFGYAPIE